MAGRALSILVVASLVAASACSSGTISGGPLGDGGVDGPTPAPEGGASEGGAADSAPAEDAGSNCTNQENSAPAITSNANPNPLPTPQGGTVVDGTYYLTSETAYGSTTNGGTKHQETLVISKGTMAIVKIGLTNPIDRATWTFTTSGTNLTRTRTCPSAKTETLGYDAAPASFITYDPLTSIQKAYKKQ